MKQDSPHKILWLASYPKSGNTWFRAFLSALYDDGIVELNNLKTDGIFSSRETFDLVTEISSRDLYDEEVKTMIADVYRYIAKEREALSIIKVHDAFSYDRDGNSIIPEDVTHCAVYFIRNPLDIAGSLANHMNFSIEDAVNMLTDTNAQLTRQPENLNKNKQFRQYLSDWSAHVMSWTAKPTFPVCVIRYEDMLSNTFETFSKVLDFIGWEYSVEKIEQAISASSFDMLRKQEAEKGFSEKGRMTPSFFRSGKMKNWEKELNTSQVDQIFGMHKKVMEKYGYLAT